MKTNDYQSPADRWQQSQQKSSNAALYWLLGIGVILLGLAGTLAMMKDGIDIDLPNIAALGKREPEQPKIDPTLMKQAQDGNADAQYAVGRILHGNGIEAQALVWYERAAQQGNAKAMNNAAVLYAEGKTVPHDLERACAYFEAAAKKLPSPEAEDNVRMCKENWAQQS